MPHVRVNFDPICSVYHPPFYSEFKRNVLSSAHYAKQLGLRLNLLESITIQKSRLRVKHKLWHAFTAK